VSTVGPAALLGSLVDLDVGDDEVGGVKTLDIGVGLSVAEESEKELGGLNGPASAGDTELLSCNHDNISMRAPSTFVAFPNSPLHPILHSTSNSNPSIEV
jgi:hypothetical protein